ncbi:hypothetical protein BAUCODRAFT_477736 [Baudoinia panamericana UAMH 10762]|uniref:Uncharacterized protein n=1 Tax=Baudoinia panamericana (strain UAMH 10762) TaxID=717646 RepID=M2MY75_BAUPA|nr:uncharacterized protein BAUCODRAFT_477736 [Baudoinia panamericana UAMH 10762]EMC96503.1 hypothetical protein BAUCODRAFT_477736 [Baudoinia panamericana UAMH 10762]
MLLTLHATRPPLGLEVEGSNIRLRLQPGASRRRQERHTERHQAFQATDAPNEAA